MSISRQGAKRILINGRFLARPITGVERVAREMVLALDARLNSFGEVTVSQKTLQFYIQTPGIRTRSEVEKRYGLELKNILIVPCGNKNVASGWRGHIWEQFDFAKQVKDHHLLNLANSAPIFSSPQTVFIHDAAIYALPSAYSRLYRLWYRFLYSALSWSTPVILTNSKFSRGEISRFMSFSKDNIHVVSLGAQRFSQLRIDSSLILKKGLDGKPFLLAVSSLQANKNFAGILRAMHLLGGDAPTLVVVGSASHQSFRQIGLDYHPRVIYLGRVTDEQLAALYRHALGLVYPSFYEGFGLPPIEAIDCGCLPLVSREASLPEVCGADVVYCNPHSASSIAHGMRRLIDMPDSERKQLVQRSQQHVSRFDWENGIDQLLTVLACEPIRNRSVKFSRWFLWRKQ
jgi:glycosyltransferase involved in cell wall biosynthesis